MLSSWEAMKCSLRAMRRTYESIYNEKSGCLDDNEDDSDVDLASQAYQIWKNATDADPALKQIIPELSDVVYSTKKAASLIEDGVITYVKTYNDYDILTWYNSSGEIVSQSQQRILQALRCDRNEPALTPMDNHLELVSKAVQNSQADRASVRGMLGNRFSTRFRIIDLMEEQVQQPTNLFFTEEKRSMLKHAIDEVYNNQLLDNSKFLLGQSMLRTSTAEDIIDTILDMHKNGNLCRIDEDKNKHKDPSIICSMGLKNE